MSLSGVVMGGDSEMFDQIVQHIGRKKCWECRAESDVSDPQMQQRQQNADCFLFIPGEHHRQREFVHIAVKRFRQSGGDPDGAVGVIALTDIHQTQQAVNGSKVPVVFAKKTQSVNIDGEVYVAEIESFTHKCKNQVIVSKKFLGPDDHVLVIDDFLANGCALQGLISIVAQAGGTVEGIGIAVEKGFQQGGRIIRNLGYQLESLAIVDGMDPATGEVHFREQ